MIFIFIISDDGRFDSISVQCTLFPMYICTFCKYQITMYIKDQQSQNIKWVRSFVRAKHDYKDLYVKKNFGYIPFRGNAS